MDTRQRRNQIVGRVNTLLADRRVSVRGLAGMTGIAVSVLFSRLTGESSFDLEELDAIATAFGVAVDSLLGSDSGDETQGEEDS